MSTYDAVENFARENIDAVLESLRHVRFVYSDRSVSENVRRVMRALEEAKNSGDDLGTLEKCRREIISATDEILSGHMQDIGMHEVGKIMMRLKTGDFVGLIIWARSEKEKLASIDSSGGHVVT